MKRFVSLILSVCFLFSINTVSYAANISSRKASNPVIQSMNDKYHVDFSGMSIDELNKFIDKMKDEDQTRASGNLLNNTQLAWLAAAQIARDKGYECAALMVEFSVYNIDYSESVTDSSTPLLQSDSPAHRHSLPAAAWCPWAGNTRRPMSSLGQHFSQISILEVLPHPAANH